MNDRNESFMDFQLVVPTATLVEDRVARVTAEGSEGSFTVLPRHVDWVSALEPGLLTYETAGGDTEHVALDTGVLVKQGRRVLVSAYSAVRHRDIDRLRDAVSSFFDNLDEKDKKARSALARMEADLITRLGENGETE